MKIKLHKNPPSYDHDLLYIGKKGFAFVGRDGKVGLNVCPECEKVNYAMAVMTGKCAWCNYQLTYPQS